MNPMAEPVKRNCEFCVKSAEKYCQDCKSFLCPFHLQRLKEHNEKGKKHTVIDAVEYAKPVECDLGDRRTPIPKSSETSGF